MESVRARQWLLYCAAMNEAMNDHIAQFVKGTHILTAAAVIALVVAAIPTSYVRPAWSLRATLARTRCSACTFTMTGSSSDLRSDFRRHPRGHPPILRNG